MQKWSQSITEQWKNLERVMEEEREWKEKNKGGRIGVSGRGVRWGEGWRDKRGGLGGLFGAWAGNVE